MFCCCCAIWANEYRLHSPENVCYLISSCYRCEDHSRHYFSETHDISEIVYIYWLHEFSKFWYQQKAKHQTLHFQVFCLTTSIASSRWSQALFNKLQSLEFKITEYMRPFVVELLLHNSVHVLIGAAKQNIIAFKTCYFKRNAPLKAI